MLCMVEDSLSHRLCGSKICNTQGFINDTVDFDWHDLIKASSKFDSRTWLEQLRNELGMCVEYESNHVPF